MLRRERRDQQLDLFCKSAFQTSLGLGIPGLLPAPLQNQTQTGHGALPAPGASLPELCVSPKQSIPRISASPEHPLDLCQPREHPLASETTHSSLCSPPRLWCRPGGVPQPAASPEITAGFSETLALPSPRVQPNISISHGVHCVTDKDKERILVPGISKLDM